MISTVPFFLLCLAFRVSTAHFLVWDEPIKTRHEQCIDQGFDGACDFKNPNDSIEYKCNQLRCARNMGWSEEINGIVYVSRYGRMPVDGTYCGPSHFCENGKCTEYPESLLPKYTGKETQVDCK